MVFEYQKYRKLNTLEHKANADLQIKKMYFVTSKYRNQCDGPW